MPEPMSPLLLQVLNWVADRPRSYADAMEAWRTSCPRMTIWEDALGGGFVEVQGGATMQQSQLTLTPRGQAIVRAHAVTQ